MYSIKPNQFNQNASDFNCVRANHPDHKKINSYLYDKIAIAKDRVQNLEKEGKPITANMVRIGLSKVNINFIGYIDQHVAQLPEENNKNCKKL